MRPSDCVKHIGASGHIWLRSHASLCSGIDRFLPPALALSIPVGDALGWLLTQTVIGACSSSLGRPGTSSRAPTVLVSMA